MSRDTRFLIAIGAVIAVLIGWFAFRSTDEIDDFGDRGETSADELDDIEIGPRRTREPVADNDEKAAAESNSEPEEETPDASGPDPATERGRPVSGRVVDSAGRGVAGAKVRIAKDTSPTSFADIDLLKIFGSIFEPGAALSKSMSDATGRFVLEGVPPGRYRAEATAKGSAQAFQNGVVVTKSQGPTLTLTLPESREASGRVVDEAGLAIEGAEVVFLEDGRDSFPGSDRMARVTSGTDGTFEAYLAKGADYQVAARRDGYASYSHDFKADVKKIEIVLSAGARVFGRVYDRANNEGLAGVTVALHTSGDTFCETTTGEDGRYEISHATPSEHFSLIAKVDGFAIDDSDESVTVDALGGFRVMQPLVAGSGVEVDVAMVGGSTVSGRVMDAATGQGIAGASVALRRAELIGALGSKPPNSMTDADGGFSIPEAPNGTVMIIATHPDYVDERIGSLMTIMGEEKGVPPLRVVPGQGLEGVELRMKRGLKVEGVVHSPEGAPVAGAEVSWQATSEKAAMMSMLMAASGIDTRRATTSEAGEFVLTGIEAGSAVSVFAKHPGFVGEVDKELGALTESQVGIEVVLSRGAAFHGRLLLPNGSGATGVRIAVASLEEKPMRMTDMIMEQPDPSMKTDSNGQFRFEALPEGKARISLKKLPFACYLDPEAANLDLVSGLDDETILRLLDYIKITGRLVDANGQPVAGASIVAKNKRSVPGMRVPSRKVRTDDEGRFVLDRLQIGPHELKCNLSSGKNEILGRFDAGSADLELIVTL